MQFCKESFCGFRAIAVFLPLCILHLKQFCSLAVSFHQECDYLASLDLAAMVKLFVCFCTRAYECSKGGKRLGAWADEAESRAKIVQHLMASTYHNLSQEEADADASSAELVEEEWPEEPQGKGDWGEAGNEKGWGGKGDKGGSQKGGKQWRHEPYGQPSSSRAMVAKPSRVQLPMDKMNAIITSISRAEAAARTAGRMASSAAHAFNEEAHVLRDALDMLRTSTAD